MNRFTLEQRWEILKAYFQSECCVAETVRILKRNFGRNNAPTAPAVRKFVKKVRETGLLIDNKSYPRVRPARTVENVAAVAESVRLNPTASIRHRSQQLKISRTSLRRILKEEECIVQMQQTNPADLSVVAPEDQQDTKKAVKNSEMDIGK